jgi:hypothetical protein
MKKIRLKESELVNLIKTVINEQSNPEDRVTDNQCVGTATPKVVLDIWEDLTKNYGYECIGREWEEGKEISKVVLKKTIQGISIYVFIDELDWGRLIEVGDVSYYIPKTAPGDSVYYEAEEGSINQLGELEALEDKILDSL